MKCTRMCGIIGVSKKTNDVNIELYEGLLMLQHRGQDSAGIVTSKNHEFFEHKDNGLVKDIFSNQEVLDTLQGSVGIGHVRYPTAGSSNVNEVQPFLVKNQLGIYIVHNGNLTNTEHLRSDINANVHTNSDSEVLANVFAEEIDHTLKSFPKMSLNNVMFKAGENMMGKMKGAYSCIALVRYVGIVAFRDPNGIRPLVLGKRSSKYGDEWCVASEDCAFGPLGFERVRDVRAGEMVIIDNDGGIYSREVSFFTKTTPCIFEYIYLARPDSIINDISVYIFQMNLGTRLARRIKECKWDIDIVCPVPDGSRPIATKISTELGLPYREGLVKNRYIGRTFIMPNKQLRELSVRRKLNAMPAVFKNKNVLLIDDSIVRGTTMQQIVKMVRNAGANKIYIASASPPVRFPNVYGVDIPSTKELIANESTEEEICKKLGADGLIYQLVDDMVSCGRELNPNIKDFDVSCFSGTYVTGDIDEQYLQDLECNGRGKRIC